MGAEDMERQALNVLRMRLLGATVRRVDAGSRTLKDAINEAMRDWVTNVADTYYLLGSVLGPHPYPLMVREFQSVIGREARAQVLEQAGRLPDAWWPASAAAATPSASSTRSSTTRRAPDRRGGRRARHLGPGATRRASRAAAPASSRARAATCCRTKHGNIELTHSISAGSTTRPSAPSTPGCATSAARSTPGSDDAAALDAFEQLARLEGILPALESAHAVAHAAGWRRRARTRRVMLVNLSGRGDKDLQTVSRALEAR
jgi:tryptophan synthase beta chain